MHSLEACEGSLQESAALFGAFFMLWGEEEWTYYLSGVAVVRL